MPMFTRCPDGYHKDKESGQCVDAQGNPYIPPAESPSDSVVPSKQKQEMERFKGRGEDIAFSSRQQFLEAIPPEQREKINQNIKQFRSTLTSLKNLSGRGSRGGKMLVPIIGPILTMWAQYDFAVQKGAIIRQKAKSREQKRMAEIYNAQLDEILDGVPEIDLSSGDVKQIESQINDAEKRIEMGMKDAKKEAQKQGRKSEAYARYRAYADYKQMCDSKRKFIQYRLENMARDDGRKREEQKARAQERVRQMRSQFGH